MKRIWIAIVKFLGWRLQLPAAGERPELQRCVIVVAPHTAVSDFLIGSAYLWQLGINGHVFIKKEFFRWPIGGLLRSLGCVAIDRGNRHNDMVGTAVREFAKGKPFSIILTPEATRKPVHRWKRGFWEIARQAGVPLVPAYIDFGRKEVGLFESFMPTDDYEADRARIHRLYRSDMAKRPAQFIEYEEKNEKLST
jgi:1-acyl-sn-glycerol-3-phosphate acyltransferase